MEIANARGKQLIFVVNGATANARITSEAAIALSQHGTVAPSVIHHRVDYAASMIDGRTVMEIDPVCRSAKEIGELWIYIEGRLKRHDGPYRGEDAQGGQQFGQGRVFGRRAAQ